MIKRKVQHSSQTAKMRDLIWIYSDCMSHVANVTRRNKMDIDMLRVTLIICLSKQIGKNDISQEDLNRFDIVYVSWQRESLYLGVIKMIQFNFPKYVFDKGYSFVYVVQCLLETNLLVITYSVLKYLKKKTSRFTVYYETKHVSWVCAKWGKQIQMAH